jgi:CRP-like cAMP-binding protein
VSRFCRRRESRRQGKWPSSAKVTPSAKRPSFAPTPRNATCRAIEETTVYALDKVDFAQVMHTSFIDNIFVEDISTENYSTSTWSSTPGCRGTMKQNTSRAP